MENEIIELWKKLKIIEVVFVFNCGGDSMEGTEIIIETVNGQIENEEIYNYIDTNVYSHVEFYEVSDGYYMGETGKVYITLNEDSEFEYAKEAESIYSYVITEQTEIELNQYQLEFMNNYVHSFGKGTVDSDFSWNYKKDFVLTDELINVKNSIVKHILQVNEDYEFNTTLEIDDVDNIIIEYDPEESKLDSQNITVNLTTLAYRYEGSY
jgi:hypothetical protein